MPRRVSLPGASELFRQTHSDLAHSDLDRADAEPTGPVAAGPPGLAAVESPEEKPARGTGRVRHDEKITVYVSADELVALERARLELRAQYGIAVDRGRMVREAIASILDDFETAAEDSRLVRRLS